MLISFRGSLIPASCIGPEAGLIGGHEVVSVPLIEAHFRTVAQGQLQGLDGDKILKTHVPGLFHGGDHGAGRPVAHPAAVEQPQGMGDDGGGHDLVDGDRLA